MVLNCPFELCYKLTNRLNKGLSGFIMGYVRIYSRVGVAAVFVIELALA
jgi:hypothetical protein